MEWLLTEIKTELIAQKHVASGKAINSLKVERDGRDWVFRGAGYLYWVNFGRKPGKFPPMQAIRNWLEAIGKSTKLAFPIARAIAQKGIPAKPYVNWTEGNSIERTNFVGQVIEKNKDRIAEEIGKEAEISIFENWSKEVVKINALNEQYT